MGSEAELLILAPNRVTVDGMNMGKEYVPGALSSVQTETLHS
jgi:hypothetical protein